MSKKIKYTDDHWQELLRQYMSGTIDKASLHALERQALDDPFLFEAMEGFQSVADVDHLRESDVIKAQIAEKTKDQGRRSRTLYLRWAGVAAAIMILIVTSVVIRSNVQQQEKGNIAVTFSEVESADENLIAQREEDASYLQDYDVESDAKEVSEAPSGIVEKKAFNQKDKAAEKKIYVSSDPKSENEVANVIDGIPVDEPASEEEVFPEVLIKATKPEEAKASRGTVARSDVTMDDISSPELRSADQPERKKRNITRQISGKVADGENIPIIGATITSNDGKFGGISDINGDFNITVDTSVDYLNVTYTGYESNTIDLDTSSHYAIALAEGKTLDEVVTIGIGTKAKVETEAFPEGGFEALETFIINNKQTPQEVYQNNIRGTVRLRFRINKDGLPSNFQVTKSLCTPCDKEAIRLIREFGIWLTEPAGQETFVTYEVEFY